MKCSCCGEEVGNVAICPICGSGMPVAPAAPNAAVSQDSEIHMSGADLFDRNVNGVLELSTRKGLSFYSGSGYLINGQGYAITNSHVVVIDGKVCDDCTAKIAGEKVSVEVIAVGTKHDFCSNQDLAVIKLHRMPVKAKPVCFGDSSRVRTGERVYIIGNSLGQGTCITSGIISDNNRNGQFMYDSATNGGNSGGPVFNEDGCVIATHVRGTPDRQGGKAQGMNGGIPSIYAMKMLDQAGIKYDVETENGGNRR